MVDKYALYSGALIKIAGKGHIKGAYVSAADYEALEAKLNNEAALADARLLSYEIACEEHKKEVRRLCERAENAEAKLAALRKAGWDVVNKTWQANEHEQCFFDALKEALEASE